MGSLLSAGLIFTVWILANLPGVALSQTSEEMERRLSLEACVAMALENHPDVVQSELDRDAARAQVWDARFAFAPQFSSTYGYSRVTTGPRDGTFLDEASGQIVDGLSESTVRRSQVLAWSLRVRLLDPGDFVALKAANRGKAATEAHLANVRQEVTFLAKRDFYNLLRAMRLHEVQQEHVRVLREDLDRVVALQEIGEAPMSEVWSARASLEEMRARLASHRNQVEQARHQLALTIGLDGATRLIPVETGEGLPLAEPIAIEAVEARLEASPALEVLRSFAEQSEASLLAARLGNWFPTVTGGIAYRYTLGEGDTFDGLSDLWNRNYATTLSVNVDVPIFNALVGRDDVRRKKIEMLRNQRALENANRVLRSELRYTVESVDRLRESADLYESAVEAATEDARLQKDAYELGQTTFQHRQQATLDLFAARSNLVRARYDYQIAVANLERLLGMAPTGASPE